MNILNKIRRPLKAAMFILLAAAVAAAGYSQIKRQIMAKNDAIAFAEIWGYLMQGEAGSVTGTEPVTDIGYFGSILGNTGRLTGVPAAPEVIMKSGVRPRMHLVIGQLFNSALLHFSINPEYSVRGRLIEEIVAASKNYHGIQIDFEGILLIDRPHFVSFLQEIRKRLPREKILSVTVPPRARKVQDGYDYKAIAAAADRVVIMAYDQHWSTSAPGPVSSIPWCDKIIAYAKSTMPEEKIIMGAPLFGRSWQDKVLARSIRHKDIAGIISRAKTPPDYTPETGNHLEYEECVNVSVYYDDVMSMSAKLRLYSEKNIRAVAFWRIGQGPPDLWKNLVIAPAARK